MRDSTYQIEKDINARLGGHRMHFKVKDQRFGRFKELWRMEYAMSMDVSKRMTPKGSFEIYISIYPAWVWKSFVIQVEVEPEKYQNNFSKAIKASPGGNIEVKEINEIPGMIVKTMGRIRQWAKSPRPLY